MYKPVTNNFIARFFSWYIQRIVKSDFHALNFNKIDFEPSEAILLLANHTSWWDGFFLFQLNKLHFKKQFHIMVSEENYKKVWFLKYLGAFSVSSSSKSIMDSLEYAGSLLNDPNNLVVVFPQGKLYSNHGSSFQFKKGVTGIINSSEKAFQYIFSATLVDYFENRKPTAYIYLDKWEGNEYISLQLLKNAYKKHFEQAVKQQSQISV